LMRLAVSDGLPELTDQDWVLISDLDEIPRAEVVRGLVQNRRPYILEQRLSYYWLNCVASEPWAWARLLPAENFFTAATGRWAPGHVVPNAGWHFSYCGGPERIQAKLEAFAHQELNTPEYNDAARIERITRQGRDLFDRPGMEFRCEPIGPSYPEHLLRERARFRPLMWPPGPELNSRPWPTTAPSPSAEQENVR